jgi:hypothetical protein
MFLRATLTAAALITAVVGLASPAYSSSGFKTDDPMCAQKNWYQVCRNPDGSWVVCGLYAPGCRPMINAGPTPLPGSTPAPGIGSAYSTGPKP